MKNVKLLRADEILALSFFLTASIVSGIYGYALRFNILIDLIFVYLLVFPIFLGFLFYTHIKDPYLKFGWVALVLSFSLGLISITALSDINPSLKTVFPDKVFKVGIILWASALICFLIKKKHTSRPNIHSAEIQKIGKNALLFIRDWAPIFIVLFSYCTLKSIIPILNPALFDDHFNAIDFYLFFKNSPTEFTLELIPVTLIGVLSFGYKFYFILKMVTFSAIYCTVKNRQVFHRLVLAFSITYILGLGLYIAFPAQGPIYYYPEKFTVIKGPMSDTSVQKLQTDLWSVYEQVKEKSPEDFYELTTSSGIRNGVAAFPSLHVAISCILLYFLYRYKRVIFWLCFLPFWMMVISTIYFGWHYVVDDIAGFALAGFVIFCMNRLLNHGVVNGLVIRIDSNHFDNP